MPHSRKSHVEAHISSSVSGPNTALFRSSWNIPGYDSTPFIVSIKQTVLIQLHFVIANGSYRNVLRACVHVYMLPSIIFLCP